MGSYNTWEPEDENRLQKEIIKDDFETREDAIKFEANLIEKYIDNELNENYHIPPNKFHTKGSDSQFKGKTLEEIYGKEKANFIKNKIKRSLSGSLYSQERVNKSKQSLIEYYKNNDGYWKGKNHSDKTKEKISNSKKDWFKKNKAYWCGKKRPNMSDMMEGSKNPMYNRTGSFNPNSKKVIHIETGKIFSSQTNAAKEFDYSPTTVSAHCKGKFKKQKFKFYEK